MADDEIASTHQHRQEPTGRRLLTLSLLALGIVYGDIGTSPLYSMRECFYGSHPVALTRANVLGVLSLIVWSLVIVVMIKYHVYVLRFDNRGEGGILALMGLVGMDKARRAAVRSTLIVLGVFGAALLYGDGMITPAISVLSAIEGLEVATPFFKPYVLPLTIIVLVLLFVFQRRGTRRIGSVFGPIMLVWFATAGAAWESAASSGTRRCCSRSIRSTPIGSSPRTGCTASSFSARCFS